MYLGISWRIRSKERVKRASRDTRKHHLESNTYTGCRTRGSAKRDAFSGSGGDRLQTKLVETPTQGLEERTSPQGCVLSHSGADNGNDDISTSSVAMYELVVYANVFLAGCFTKGRC